MERTRNHKGKRAQSDQPPRVPAAHDTSRLGLAVEAFSAEEEQIYHLYLGHYLRPSRRRQPVIKTHLGAALLTWIHQAHLLQGEAAAILGVDKKLLWRYLTGGLCPSIPMLERLHTVTGIGRDELLRLAAQVPRGGSVVSHQRHAATPGASNAPHTPQRAPTRPIPPPVPADAWEAFATRLRTILPEGAERRAVLASYEALRAGALTPAARIVPAPPRGARGAALEEGMGEGMAPLAGGRGMVSDNSRDSSHDSNEGASQAAAVPVS